MIPGALLSILPVVSCPSCWPAYAGVLGSLGVPFLMESILAAPSHRRALLLSLAGLGYRASPSHFGPLALNALAATGILLGKFALG